MNIHGPNLFESRYRIQEIDGDRNDDANQDEKRRRRVQYRGRAWAESEEDLPVQPTAAPPVAVEEREGPARGMYGDRVLLERAQKAFNQLVTLEDKVAQLLFLVTEANYDTETKQQMELQIQLFRIGGLLFTQGDFKRQSYLINHYQSLSKIPLLVGNDFLHGLSFYFQGELPLASFGERMTEQRYSDLGKAVMVQNRSLGVHFQYDSERSSGHIPMQDEQMRAFRKGVRGAHGIVGQTQRNSKLSTLFGREQMHDTISMRTLNFLDLTQAEDIEKALIEGTYEAVLLEGNVEETIRTLCKAVRSGKIRMAELDRRVMKVLLIKVLTS